MKQRPTRSAWSRCIPPIRWVQNTFVPPRDDDWTRIAFQPMLYFASFVAAVVIVVFGDFTDVPQHPGIDIDRSYGLYWTWAGLALVAPPMALGSLWLIQHREGKPRYRGLWLRLGADILQLVAMTIYLILRLMWGDYHIYPVTILGAAALFVAHLIIRDVKRLIQVEQLAIRLHRNGHDAR